MFKICAVPSRRLLTLFQIAATLSKALGRTIEHVKLDEEGRYQNLVQAGLEEYYAHFVADLEGKAAQGLHTAQGDDVEKVTGHAPKNFETFAKENAAAWM